MSVSFLPVVTFEKVEKNVLCNFRHNGFKAINK